MIPLIVLRHGPTAWNAEKKIQGRSDIALSDAGRKIVESWHLDPEFMGLGPSRSIPRLIEMNWGDWEGRHLSDVRAELGLKMLENERRGLDFRPPGGESPRDVQVRLGEWLGDVDGPTVAVTHKGIIRALYALACGWDMTDPPPQKLRDGMAHGFLIDRDGKLTVERLNIPLEAIEK